MLDLSPKHLTYLSLCCGALVFFATIALLFFPKLFDRFDQKRAFKKQRKAGLTALALFINDRISVKTVCVFYFLVGLILLFLHKWHILGIVGGSMLLASMLFFSIKRITQRPRPEQAFLKFKDYSFPSGHTTAGFVFFLSCALALHWTLELNWGLELLYLLALGAGAVVGRSRWYLSVHRVSDILVGGMLGSGTFVLLYLLFFYF